MTGTCACCQRSEHEAGKHLECMFAAAAISDPACLADPQSTGAHATDWAAGGGCWAHQDCPQGEEEQPGPARGAALDLHRPHIGRVHDVAVVIQEARRVAVLPRIYDQLMLPAWRQQHALGKIMTEAGVSHLHTMQMHVDEELVIWNRVSVSCQEPRKGRSWQGTCILTLGRVRVPFCPSEVCSRSLTLSSSSPPMPYALSALRSSCSVLVLTTPAYSPRTTSFGRLCSWAMLSKIIAHARH